MLKYTLIILILVGQLSLSATTYYVRKDGTNTNNGKTNTAGGAFLTIGKAATIMVAGDVTRVQGMTTNVLYDERVTVNISGTLGNPITYLAENGNSTNRGFSLSSANYINIIGFNIQHSNTTFNRGITLAGVNSNINIYDNNLQYINGSGILGLTPSTNSYITVRGNTMYFMGMVPGVATNVSVLGVGNYFISSDHWLVEYNIVQRSGDFINVYGQNNIIRNNFLWDYADIYWGASSAFHSDMFQPGSDGTAVRTRNHVYEANFCYLSIESNSHFGIWQDTVNDGDTNIIIRGNIAHKFGGGGVGVISTDHVVTYNNTFNGMCQAGAGAILIWYKGGGASTNFSLYNMGANTIISEAGLTADSIDLPAGNSAIITNNLGYAALTDSSFVSTNNPLFVNTNSLNFRLQATSPARAAGTNILYVTSSNGSGTSFDVNDGALLIDGWSIVNGDTITINGTTTTVTGISNNTLTVANSVTWTTNMPVYWGIDTSPDIGAFPYESIELTSALLYKNGANYSCVPTGDSRFVVFYDNGIPQTPDYSSPYTYSAAASTNIVTAKVYALYAQQAPVITSTLVDITSKAINYGTIRGNTTLR